MNDLERNSGQNQVDSLKALYELKKNPSNKETQKSIDQYVSNLNNIQKQCDQLIKEANDKGYKITSKEVIRSRIQGKQYFDFVRETPNLHKLYNLEILWTDYGPTYYTTSNGNKYKVKKR